MILRDGSHRPIFLSREMGYDTLRSMNERRWPFFLPASAEDQNDLKTSWNLLQPLRTIGIDPGLMLVARGGIDGLTNGTALRQQQHLRLLSASYGDAPIVVMLANFPLREMDWLHHAEKAASHIRTGIQFASHLPLSGHKSITFHLNALCDEKEFRTRSAQAWRQRFDTIRSALASLTKKAKQKGCSLLVETVPIPEFGDVSPHDGRTYRQCRLRDLRDPWYLTTHWGIPELKNIGLGVVLDLCHARTIFQSLRTNEERTGIFPEDKAALQSLTIMDEVRALQETDLVHLNDGREIWTESEGCFEEGVALGEGDIQELPEIIRYLRHACIPTVLEVDDGGDFIGRPGSTRSLVYLRRCLSAKPPPY